MSELADHARDPDRTPEELLDLAREAPEAVLENPALPIIALESPDLYGRIVGHARNRMASLALQDLLSTFRLEEGRLYAIACGEEALAFLARLGEVPSALENLVHEAKEFVLGLREKSPEDSRALQEVMRYRKEKDKVRERAAVAMMAMCRGLASSASDMQGDLFTCAQSLSLGEGLLRGPLESGPCLMAKADKLEAMLRLANEIAGGRPAGR